MDHLRENIAAFIDSYYNRADVAGSEFEFFRHEEIFRSDVGSKTEGEPARNRLPPTIVSIGFRLAIPRRVALEHCPLPLRQPRTIVAENRRFELGKSNERRVCQSQFVSTEGSPIAV